MATIERKEHNIAKLTISVDAETFASAVQQAYFKTAKHYNIPGFRKGKAPRKVIENMYGTAVFFEDAFDIVWGEAYDIVLGGGYLSLRSPYYLAKGDVTYAMLYSIFPFDNELVLCSIKGSDLKRRFFETSNDSYFIGYGAYGESVRNNLNSDATYYIIVDSYSASYAPNRLTEIARYNEKVYARDLLAEYVKAGGLE